MDREIHVVSIPQCFKDPEDMIRKAEQELKEFAGKTVILLFPEAAIGRIEKDEQQSRRLIPKAIERDAGKRLANKLHELASKHGSAHIAYSVIERLHNAPGQVRRAETNSGYLIMPRKEHNRGYKVYSKFTTYKMGTRLTYFDKDNISRSFSEEEIAQMAKRRAGFLKNFPETMVHGKRVQLRVCSDAADQKPKNKTRGVVTDYYMAQDYHPARETKDIHLILSPSRGNAFSEKDKEFIARRLAPEGMLVKSDAVRNHEAHVLVRKERTARDQSARQNSPYKTKAFTVHHMP